jgi:hypothetical protein
MRPPPAANGPIKKRRLDMARRFLLATMIVAATAATALAGGGPLCVIEGCGEAYTDDQIAALRAEGPAGLSRALDRLDSLVWAIGEVDALLANEAEPAERFVVAREKAEKHLAAMRAQIDAIAGQRDASVSRLFWYTDLDAARQAAADSGKPILSRGCSASSPTS